MSIYIATVGTVALREQSNMYNEYNGGCKVECPANPLIVQRNSLMALLVLGSVSGSVYWR